MSTINCPLCGTVNDDKDKRCTTCEYPLQMKSGPVIPEKATPYPQSWTASARHKESGALVAGWLVQVKGYELKVFDLFFGTNVLGRNPDTHVDIVIAGDPLVSRVHAVVDCSLRDGNRIEYRVTDKSTNGTYIEDAKESTTQQIIDDGVKITIGRSELVFKSVYMAIHHLEALQQVSRSSKYIY